MLRSSNVLIDTALTYAGLGVPVTPAWRVVRDAEAKSRWFRRGALICECGDHACPTQGSHPCAEARLLDPEAIRATWDVAAPPSLMISSSQTLAIWRVPLQIGSYGMRILEHQRLNVWPPVMRLSEDSWIFCTAPPEQVMGTIGGPGAQVELLGPESPILVPPSRNAARKVHWLWSRQFPAAPLTDAGIVLMALAAAADQYGTAHGVPHEHRTNASVAPNGRAR